MPPLILSMMFCSFQSANFVLLLLNLFLSILFFDILFINGIVFLMSFSDCSLLVFRNTVSSGGLVPGTPVYTKVCRCSNPLYKIM